MKKEKTTGNQGRLASTGKNRRHASAARMMRGLLHAEQMADLWASIMGAMAADIFQRCRDERKIRRLCARIAKEMGGMPAAGHPASVCKGACDALAIRLRCTQDRKFAEACRCAIDHEDAMAGQRREKLRERGRLRLRAKVAVHE